MREIVAAVRQAIPDAAGALPGAVLEHVLGALRAAQAKPIYLLRLNSRMIPKVDFTTEWRNHSHSNFAHLGVS